MNLILSDDILSADYKWVTKVNEMEDTDMMERVRRFQNTTFRASVI